MKAVILAAGMGTRLEVVSGGVPKCMVQVGGRPLVDRMIERLDQAGLDDLIIVTGHRADQLEAHIRTVENRLAKKAVFVHNPRYHDWGNFYSLLIARDAIGSDGYVSLDGDVLMDDTLMPALMNAQGPAVLAIERKADLGEEEMKIRVDENGNIVELNKRISPALALGEFVGIERVDAELTGQAFAALQELIDVGETHEYYERAYERMMQAGVTGFRYVDITASKWCEIDDAADLEFANRLAAEID